MNLKLATPEGVVFNNQIQDLIVKGAVGELNILPRHTNFVTFIQAGPLKVRTGKEAQEFHLTDGILKVEGDEVTILCSRAEAA